MAQNLTGLGAVNYNGVVLSGPFLKSKLSSTPVWDAAQRVIMYWRIEISLETNISPLTHDVTTDGAMEDMRQALSTPGGALAYEGIGWGHMEVGPAQDMVDCNYGPKPEQVTFETYGAVTAKLTFRISTCIPEQCFVKAGRRPQIAQPMAASWEWNTEIRRGGWSTVRWNINAMIPLSFTNLATQNIQATADRLKEKLTPPLPLGFTREFSWQLSADKRALTGTVVDTEIPVALPPGVALIDVHHDARSGVSQAEGGFTKWTHTLRGSAHAIRGMSKADLWKRVFIVIGQYLQFARQQTPTGPPVPPAVSRPNINIASIPPVLVLPAIGLGAFAAPAIGVSRAPTPASQPLQIGVFVAQFQVGEDVFGDGLTFHMVYWQIGSSLRSILNDGGFFRPLDWSKAGLSGIATVGANDWERWQNSLTGKGLPFDPRGGAQLAYSPQMEGIVIDLCNSNTGNAIIPP